MLTRRGRSNESGIVLVFTAALLIVLLGFAALAVDLGQAWSNNRRAQTATDLAVMGALQQIPHTFQDPGIPAGTGAQTVAIAEATDLITDNNAVAGAVNVDLALTGGNLSVTAAATINSPNAFARAIGAGGAVTVNGSATGEVLINFASLDVMPIGFNGVSDPFRCVFFTTTPPPPPAGCNRTVNPQPSQDLIILGMRRPLTKQCNNLNNVMTDNFLFGIDHLVDVASTGDRTEENSCPDNLGHPLTMPTTTQTVPLSRGDFSSYITAGVGGRLDGNGETLWDKLLPGLAGACNKASYAALPDVQARSAQMSTCLSSGNARFSGLSGSPRFVYAIDTSAGGAGARYDGYVPVWLNTVIDNATFTDHIDPAGVGPLTGFTLYLLNNANIGTTLEFDPGGIDNLEFQLTD